MKLFRKEEGFTLVELMVVVLIIGILVSIAIPVFNAAKGNAQKKSCYANQRTIEGAAQTYSADNDSVLPAAVADLTPKYLKSTPKCPDPSASAYSFDATKADGSVAACSIAAHGYYQ